MKLCPTCQRRYADSLKFCLEDGTVLEPAREAEPTLVDPQATLRLTPRETSPPATQTKRGNTLIFVTVGAVVLVGIIAVVAVIVVLQLNSTRGLTTQSSPASNANPNPRASPEMVTDSAAVIIERTNNEVGAALVNGDTDALNRLLSDDYRYVSDAGLTLNKAEVLLLIRTGNLSYEYLRTTNTPKVEMNSDSTKAELTATAESKGQLRRQSFTDTYFYKNTYEKRGDKWQLVSGTVWHRQ